MKFDDEYFASRRVNDRADKFLKDIQWSEHFLEEAKQTDKAVEEILINMNIEQQDLNWIRLTKEVREELRKRYKNWREGISFETEIILYNELFGEHNLTSTIEPEEILITSVTKVTERIKYLKTHPKEHSIRDADERVAEILSFFGDKCLPISSSKVKFQLKEGDLCIYKKELAEIIQIDITNPYPYLILPKNKFSCWVSEGDLEPYIKPSITPFEVGDEVIANIGRPVPAKIIEIINEEFAVILYRDITKKVSLNNLTHYDELISKEAVDDKEKTVKETPLK